MNRRDFHRLSARGAALGLPLTGAIGSVLAPSAASAATAAPAAATSSANALWARAYDAVPEVWTPLRVAFDRPLPEALSGTIWRNGPARMRRGDTRYTHWFDGDGMVHSFRLRGDAVVHAGKMIRTDKYRADEAAGRFLRDGFGTAVPGSQPFARPDEANVANISVLPLGRELLALWEAGSPWRVDPTSLDTLGRKVWSPASDGLPFSAHPRIEADGSVWSFGYLTGSSKLALWRLRPDGSLATLRVIDAPNTDMVHDFAITDRHLVFLLMPLRLDPQAPRDAAFIDRLRWRDGEPSVLLLVDKDTLTVSHRAELPAHAFFHLGNAWREADTVTLQVMSLGGMASTMTAIRAAMAGQPAEGLGSAMLEVRMGLNDRRVRVERTPMRDAEFPVWDARRTGQTTRHLMALAAAESLPAGGFGFNAIRRFDRVSGQVSGFDLGAGMLADEHLFVPQPGGGEGEGWLIGTAHDRQAERTVLSVYRAQALGDGPVSQAVIPRRLPPGLHGRFQAA
jgi:carotenoid cleavage dioxygenase